MPSKPKFNPADWPAMNVRLVDIGDLVPLATNARTHSAAQIFQIKKSLEQFKWTIPILVDEDNMIIAGHGRIMAAREMKMPQVPVAVAKGWSEAEKRAYALLDNLIYESGDWDEEARDNEIDAVADLGIDLSDYDFDAYEPDEEDEDEAPPLTVSLADRFGIPPFTILNAREGWWQNRKRAWLALGIRSEEGRGENLLKFSDSIALDGKAYNERFKGKKGHNSHLSKEGKKALGAYAAYGNAGVISRKKGQAKSYNTSECLKEKGLSGGAQDVAGGSGTSIFDPVLCELCYAWFSPPEGRIFDPFAGGSVRGIVAAMLDRKYTGIDLSSDQIKANKSQGKSILKGKKKTMPKWHNGDSAQIDTILPKDYRCDFLFSCPPYADLEVYSDDPADISAMNYPDFLEAYRKIIFLAAQRLENNSFAVFVTGDARGKDGNYYGFPEDTNAAFEAAGLKKYNEAILVTAVGSLPIRITKQFNASRKLGKTHQNVQIFLKGDAKKAVAKLSAPEFAMIEASVDEAGGFEIDQ